METEQTRGYTLLSHRVAIQTRYYPPTDHRGSRIGVSHVGGKKIFVSWEYSLDTQENHQRAVNIYLDNMEWSGKWILGAGADARGYIAVWAGDNA